MDELNVVGLNVDISFRDENRNELGYYDDVVITIRKPKEQIEEHAEPTDQEGSIEEPMKPDTIAEPEDDQTELIDAINLVLEAHDPSVPQESPVSEQEITEQRIADLELMIIELLSGGGM